MPKPIENVSWNDTVLPFKLDKTDISGRIARLDGVLGTILEQHNYPLDVSALLAEAVVLTALIGQTIKLGWKLSLQIRGNGPIRFLATDYYGPEKEGDPARMRAYASFDEDRLKSETDTSFEKIGTGIFAILIDQDADQQPYQGITPLAGGSLAACASTYFAQSEQLPTEFAVSIGQLSTMDAPDQWHAGGIMVQLKSDVSGFSKDSKDDNPLLAQDLILHEKEDDWNRVISHLQTVEETELVGAVSPETLLTRLFHEDAPRIYPVQPVTFGCSCSVEKLRAALSNYAAKDIESMTKDSGMVTADCQFCGGHYQLDPKTLGVDATA
ncbi:MAG: Hsp33 family molecular chaperone HslO [Rhodobacterales bacterium]